MADTQISATGGEFTEQTSIQIRGGSTTTDFRPVDDDVEQFPAREEEEVTETEISREDPVMQISGTGHWFLEGWIGDHSVILGGLGIFSDSYVRHFFRNLVQAGAPLSCSHTYTDLGGGSAAQEYGRWSAILRQLP